MKACAASGAIIIVISTEVSIMVKRLPRHGDVYIEASSVDLEGLFHLSFHVDNTRSTSKVRRSILSSSTSGV